MLPSVITVNKQGKSSLDLVTSDFLNRRRVYLVGEINDASAMEVVMQLDYLAASSDGEITLVINSPGGSVTAGLAIIDAMERAGAVSTLVTGMAASMAAVIAACGAKGRRFVTPMAEVMIHQPLGGISGQATEIENTARRILGIKRRMSALLAQKTGQTERKITADCERDHYLSAEEAVRYGLADEVFHGRAGGKGTSVGVS